MAGGASTSTTRRESDKEKTKVRERQRRAITTNIFQGLRRHGGYHLSPRADINQVLRHLAFEAGWVVEPDGTTYRYKLMNRCPTCGSVPPTTTTSSTVVAGGDCSTNASPRRVDPPPDMLLTTDGNINGGLLNTTDVGAASSSACFSGGDSSDVDIAHPPPPPPALYTYGGLPSGLHYPCIAPTGASLLGEDATNVGVTPTQPQHQLQGPPQYSG